MLISKNANVEHKVSVGALLDKGPEKSPIKVKHPRKVDLRAHYWAFLFDNLRRAVDQIYVTCESDQSVVECKVSANYFGSFFWGGGLFIYCTFKDSALCQKGSLKTSWQENYHRSGMVYP